MAHVVSTLFPYTTLFRSGRRPGNLQQRLVGHSRPAEQLEGASVARERRAQHALCPGGRHVRGPQTQALQTRDLEIRSEEHTSELQSRFDLVCRLLLEKKK